MQYNCLKMAQSPGFQLLNRISKVYIAILVVFVAYYMHLQWNSPHSTLAQLNNQTAAEISQLVKTKFFRIIRINLQTDCPFWAQMKMCNSGGCNVCRCDEKDIPIEWSKTDEAVQATVNRDLWANERQNETKHANDLGVWHVEDLENDKGEYFDIDLNKEAFTKYNGSVIWQMIYNENCFSGNFQSMCKEEKVLYQLISGLHTSVSTHLSYFYKNVTPLVPGFPKTQDSDVYFINHAQYHRRVGDHPTRIQALYFLYKLLLKSLSSIESLLRQYPITSDNIQDDLKAKTLLLSVLTKLQKTPLQLDELSSLNPNYINSYQKYIHNISRILDCVQCQKCRLFGKMQTYGMGTAMKITLGYRHLKRNQLVALLNLVNKVSMSVRIHQELIQKRVSRTATTYLNIYMYVGISFLGFAYFALYFNEFMKKKAKRMFKHAFPKAQ